MFPQPSLITRTISQYVCIELNKVHTSLGILYGDAIVRSWFQVLSLIVQDTR